MSRYHVCAPDKPHITLFHSAALGEVVEALLAQDKPLIVYRSQNGAALPLTDDDVQSLRDELGDGRQVDRATPTDTAVTPV